VDKLEEILAAEEQATKTVEAGREEARKIRAAADAAGTALREQSAENAAAESRSLRVRVLEKAGSEAAAVESGAAERLETSLGAARARLDAAAGEIVKELAG
jgi:hypothetical protein